MLNSLESNNAVQNDDHMDKKNDANETKDVPEQNEDFSDVVDTIQKCSFDLALQTREQVYFEFFFFFLKQQFQSDVDTTNNKCEIETDLPPTQKVCF